MTFYLPNTRAEKAAKALAEAEKRHDSRKECFKLDNYTCRCCGKKYKGHAHHIIHGHRKAIHDLWNRITLCNQCHAGVHGEADVEFMGKVLRGWRLMLAILDKWKLSVEYRWAEVYEHAKTQAEKQEGRINGKV